jgi:hypothetical protein
MGTIPELLALGCAGLLVVEEGDLAQTLTIAQDLAANLVAARAQETERQRGGAIPRDIVSEVSLFATSPRSHQEGRPLARGGRYVTGFLWTRYPRSRCRSTCGNLTTGKNDVRTPCAQGGLAVPNFVPLASEPAIGRLHRVIIFDIPFGPQSYSLSATAYRRTRESERAIRPIS